MRESQRVKGLRSKLSPKEFSQGRSFLLAGFVGKETMEGYRDCLEGILWGTTEGILEPKT